jgi:hypothetical protein
MGTGTASYGMSSRIHYIARLGIHCIMEHDCDIIWSIRRKMNKLSCSLSLILVHAPDSAGAVPSLLPMQPPNPPHSFFEPEAHVGVVFLFVL